MTDDKYRAVGTVAAMPIALTRDDVAGLPGAGRVVFGPGGQEFNLFRDGLRRLLNTYVAGMHAGYGLAALAEPKAFLLAARQLADTLYGDGDRVVDSSPSNADFTSAINALFPDANLDSPSTPFHPTDTPALRGRPIFVVGCPRSGTTWLQSMLLAHPDLNGPREETAMFSSVKDVLANDAVRAHVGDAVVIDAVRAFAETMFVNSLAATPDARLVEKTPHHALHLDIIEALFPDAFVIAIHRDGRDVVRSLLEVDFGTDDPGRAARGWVASTNAVERFRPTTLQVRDVEYESLRNDPVTGISELLEWAGLPVDDAVRAQLVERAGTRVSEHNQRDVALSPAAMHEVIRHAGEQLVHLGYLGAGELAAIRRSPGYRAAIVSSDVLHKAKQYGGKLRRLRKK